MEQIKVKKMSKKGIGVMMLFMGLGGFILPFFGYQFRLLNLLGSAQFVVAGILAILGLIVFIAGLRE